MKSTTSMEDDYAAAESGVVISEMPALEPDCSPINSPSRTCISADNNNITTNSADILTQKQHYRLQHYNTTMEGSDRLSKLDDDVAEELYKAKMDKIATMFKSADASAIDEKTALKTSASGISDPDSVPTVKVALSESPIKVFNESMKKALSTALEKSNNSLRCSAEMRIAQIYMNSNQIIRSLNKLKDMKSPNNVGKNQPVKATKTSIPAKPVPKTSEGEEDEIMEEIYRLDEILKEKTAKSGEISVKATPANTSSISLAKNNKKNEQQQIVNQGMIRGLSASDLQRMVVNRTSNNNYYPATTKNSSSKKQPLLYSNKKVRLANSHNSSKVLDRAKTISSSFSSVKKTTKPLMLTAKKEWIKPMAKTIDLTKKKPQSEPQSIFKKGFIKRNNNSNNAVLPSSNMKVKPNSSNNHNRLRL